MFRNSLLCYAVLFGILTWPVIASGNTADVLTYLGGPGSQQLRTALPLSDGTILIGGGADSMDWLPPGTSITSLVGEVPGGKSGKTAFVLRVSADLQKLQQVFALPTGAAVDIRQLKTTSLPGAATGAIYLSGSRIGEKATNTKSGYFIAKLDGNFVERAPTKLEWIVPVNAGDSIAEYQPWDVGSDGKVIYGEGTPHGYDWVAIRRLTASGQPDVVQDWRTHVCVKDGQRQDWAGTPASQCPNGQVVESLIVLKVWGRGDFRSWSQADYEAKSSDGNGGVKQGRWPYDAFFEGPYNPADPKASPRGRGYTGYGWPSTPCGNISAIVIDRRTNHFYLGGNNKSTLPKNPDFEPYVLAMTETGKLQWWMRLYREVPPEPGTSKLENVDKRLSTPDQYIDGMAIDYSASGPGALVVLARCHGNNVINFWNGNQIVHPTNPKKSFQPHFTGSNGNIHYGWLGRMTLDQGEMLHATYIGEYAEGTKVGKTSWDDPNLDQWPRFDSAWPDINTTRCRPAVNVDARGNIYVCGTGRRPVTTKNALQKMPKPDEGQSRWTDFVRVYNSDLTTLLYSSIIAGTWDWKTGEGGSGVSLQAAVPTKDGFVVVGHTTVDAKSGEIGKTAIPVQNAPAWSKTQRAGEDGVLGRLKF